MRLAAFRRASRASGSPGSLGLTRELPGLAESLFADTHRWQI